MTALWQFETAQFRVRFDAEPEECDPAELMCTDEDIAFARDGDPAHWFGAMVTVTHKATGLVLGRSYLGGCSYRSFDEFISGHRDPDPQNRNCTIMRAARGDNAVMCHYFPGMVSEAIDAARATLRAMAQIKTK